MLWLVGTIPQAVAAAPSNDAIENAAKAYLGFSDVVNMAEATADDAIDPIAAEGFCGYDDSVWASSVWYRFKAHSHGVVHVDASASDFVPNIVVMTNVFDLELLQLETCDGHKASFSTRKGQTYYIGVASSDRAGTLHVSIGKGSATPEVQATANRIGVLRHHGSAVRIRGTYSCRRANYIDINTRVLQDEDEFGEFQQFGEVGIQLFDARCDGKRHHWTVTVSNGTGGHFHRGPALLRSFSNVASCSTSGCYSPSSVDFPERWITLRSARAG